MSLDAPTPSVPTCRYAPQSPAGQRQLRAEAADRGGAQGERAVVQTGKLDNDLEAETGAWLGLIEPPAASTHLLALGRRKTRPIIVDDDENARVLAVGISFDFLGLLGATGCAIHHDFDGDA